MRVFMTGASGFIGSKLAFRLAEENHRLTVLMRDPSKAEEFASAGMTVIYGDLSDRAKLKAAMKDCDWVFHLAAFTRPVSSDPGLPHKINVEGTRNVLEAAKEQSVKKVIITSTAGTMGHSPDGQPVDETVRSDPEHNTEYERTKAFSEKLALDYSTYNLEIVVVNPTRVYGPGKMTVSNSLTKIIRLYGRGLWRIIPGDGESTGNYVFIDDVVRGHMLAAVHGSGGERYILGGENIKYNDLFNILGDLYGRKRTLFKIKEPSLKRIVKTVGLYSKLTGTPAVISSEWIDKYLRNWIVSSNKAETFLNYKITPFREGAAKTIQWLRSNNK
jgi:nucleoside-diphosphate-sugar epimerase